MGSKREMYRDYHTANKIITEVGVAILTGRLVSDCPEVIRFLRNNEFSEEIVEQITSVGFNNRIYRAVTSYDKHKEVARLFAGMDKIERERRRKFRLLSVGYTIVMVAAADIWSSLHTTRWIRCL